MNFKKLLTASALGISLLVAPACKHNKRPGDGETGVVLAGFIKDMASGNCAISVNGTGLWYGKVVETAITDSRTNFTQTANAFDKVDYQDVTKETLTDAQWASLTYNKRYNAFFSTGTVWTLATRNAALSATRAKMNAVAGLGYIAAACDASKASSTALSALGASSTTSFGALVEAWYGKLNAVEQAEVTSFYSTVLNGVVKPTLLTNAFNNSKIRSGFPNIANNSTAPPTGISNSYTSGALDTTKAVANLNAIMNDLSLNGGGLLAPAYLSAANTGLSGVKCSDVLTNNASTFGASPLDATKLVTRVATLAGAMTTLGATCGNNATLQTYFATAIVDGSGGASFTTMFTAFLGSACSSDTTILTTAFGAANLTTAVGTANGSIVNSCIILDRLSKLASYTLTKDDVIKNDIPAFPSSKNSNSDTTADGTVTAGPYANQYTIWDPTSTNAALVFTNKTRVSVYNAMSDQNKALYAIQGLVSALGYNFYSLGSTNLRCPAVEYSTSYGYTTTSIPPAGWSTDPVGTGVDNSGATNYFPSGTLRCDVTSGSTTLTNCTNISANIPYGSIISGTNIPSGTVVTSISNPTTATSITISQAPTATTATQTLTFNGNDYVTTCSWANGSDTLVCPALSGAFSFIGAKVFGTGIPTGATVSAIYNNGGSAVFPATTNATVKLSSATTAEGSNITITFRTTTSNSGNMTANTGNKNVAYLNGTIFLALTSLVPQNIPQGFAPSYTISPSPTLGSTTTYSTSQSLLGLRSVVGSGALACARIPKTSCNFGAVTTPNRQVDLDSVSGKVAAIANNQDCAKTDSNTLAVLEASLKAESNVLPPTSSVSAVTGNKVLADKAYPKFGNLVDLGFGMIMPVKAGTDAYPTYTSATDLTTKEDLFNSAGKGGSNLNLSLVESCDSIGLASGPFPNAPANVKKSLSSTTEIIYSLSTAGSAASAYNALRTTTTKASGSISGRWYATTNNTTGAITGVIFSDVSVSATGANGVTITSTPKLSLPYPTSVYAQDSTIAWDATQSLYKDPNVDFNTTGTFTGALAIGKTITGVRLGNSTTIIGYAGGYNSITISAPPTALTATINGMTVDLTVTESVSGTAYGTFVGYFQNQDFNTGAIAVDGSKFTAPTEHQAVACNASFRKSMTFPTVVAPAGYKLPDVQATSGDGGVTSLLSICTYGVPVDGINDAKSLQTDTAKQTTYAQSAFASILTGALGGTSTNAVGACSDAAKAAATQFGEMSSK